MRCSVLLLNSKLEPPAAPTAEFDLSPIDDDPDAACLRLAGELDIATAPQLDLALGEAVSRAGLLVLDLSDLEFVDCAGVRVIVNAGIRARRAGRRLLLVRGPASVDRAFRLMGSSCADLEVVRHPRSRSVAAIANGRPSAPRDDGQQAVGPSSGVGAP